MYGSTRYCGSSTRWSPPGTRRPRPEEHVVFGDHGVGAVRDAVLPHIAGTQSVGGHGELRRRRGSAAAPTGNMPASRRRCPATTAHPAAGGRWPNTSARLRAGVELHLQRVVVLPRDVEAPGQAHHAAGAVGAALLPAASSFAGSQSSITRRASAFSGTCRRCPWAASACDSASPR